jgi:hypothetical protein
MFNTFAFVPDKGKKPTSETFCFNNIRHDGKSSEYVLS